MFVYGSSNFCLFLICVQSSPALAVLERGVRGALGARLPYRVNEIKTFMILAGRKETFTTIKDHKTITKLNPLK